MLEETCVTIDNAIDAYEGPHCAQLLQLEPQSLGRRTLFEVVRIIAFLISGIVAISVFVNVGNTLFFEAPAINSTLNFVDFVLLSLCLVFAFCSFAKVPAAWFSKVRVFQKYDGWEEFSQ